MFKIIPEPVKITVKDGKNFPFKAIKLGENPLSKNAAEDFTSFFDFEESKEANVIFTTDEGIGQEGYTLEVKDGIITVCSSEPSGAFYALQTLKQLLLQGNMELPELIIEDLPSYSYRGLMLDAGRYFYSVSDVKLFIDRMALHKLNRLHFHLTEDQGWRVEIKKYPLLTQIGSKRSCTNFNNVPHGGFYTQEDIKEIVEYCHSKYIKVIPEFDVPGHCRSAIAAYSELACFPRELPVATHWGVKKDVLCAGRESTFDFVFDVIDELCALFPDKLFHIGGDEVPKHRWSICPECQKRISDEGLSNEEELQEYFMNRVYAHLKNKGYEVFMWNFDNLKPSILDKNIGFSLCNGEAHGRTCVDTSVNAYYFDLPYGYIPLEKVCRHEIKDCIGSEAQVWTEYIPNMKRADAMLFPRLGAMCEAAWHGKCDYEAYLQKLDLYYSLLDKAKIGYSFGKSKLNPKGIRKILSIALFERRRLHWEGLNILIDDKIVERLAKKQRGAE